MDNFDDLFTAQSRSEELPFDKATWSERKRKEREDAYALFDEGTQDIASNFEFFRDYLDVQSHFDRYSVSKDSVKTELQNLKSATGGKTVTDPFLDR